MRIPFVFNILFVGRLLVFLPAMQNAGFCLRTEGTPTSYSDLEGWNVKGRGVVP